MFRLFLTVRDSNCNEPKCHIHTLASVYPEVSTYQHHFINLSTHIMLNLPFCLSSFSSQLFAHTQTNPILSKEDAQMEMGWPSISKMSQYIFKSVFCRSLGVSDRLLLSRPDNLIGSSWVDLITFLTPALPFTPSLTVLGCPLFVKLLL